MKHDGWPGYQMVNATAPTGKDQGSMAPGGNVSTTAANQIYGTVIANAMATNPDVVLLMIGVNDMFYPDYLHADQRGREFSRTLWIKSREFRLRHRDRSTEKSLRGSGDWLGNTRLDPT